jgi:hypothetical protein
VSVWALYTVSAPTTALGHPAHIESICRATCPLVPPTEYRAYVSSLPTLHRSPVRSYSLSAASSPSTTSDECVCFASQHRVCVLSYWLLLVPRYTFSLSMSQPANIEVKGTINDEVHPTSDEVKETIKDEVHIWFRNKRILILPARQGNERGSMKG